MPNDESRRELGNMIHWLGDKVFASEELDHRPMAAKIANNIVVACGPCCTEDVHSSGMDEDNAKLWQLEEVF
jgi:hypothetical protein